MKLKRFLILGLFATLLIGVRAQIQLTPLVTGFSDGLDANVKDVVENRLRSIISANGLRSGVNTPFVLATKFNVVNTEIIPGPPTKFVLSLEITLAVGNGTSNQCFASYTFEAKGVGNTEQRAMIAALKSMKTKNKDISNLVTVATERIVQYYEETAPKIMASANAAITNKNYEEAVEMLSHIPQECSYFNDAAALMTTAYQKHIDETAAQILMKAKSMWATSQDEANASEIVRLLTSIDPNAACYGEANKLVNQIASRIQKLKDEALAYERKMEQQAMKNAADLEKQRIKAARDVAVAYAENQPKVVYNWIW